MTSHRAAVSVLALIAMLLVGALGAAQAQAESEFLAWRGVEVEEGFEEEEPTPATVEAVPEGRLELKLGTRTITCYSLTASGTLPTGSSPTLTLTPSYSSCIASFGGSILAVNVAGNSCAFVTHLGEEIETGAFDAPTDLACGEESKLEFKVTLNPETKLCTYDISS
jgi:hypothetical protein